MPNESGYVDFNQYFDANQSEEERLMQEAMDRARSADTKAKSALARSKTEAQGRYGADGQISGEQADLTQTASYGDYLAAKKSAEEAYAGVGGASASPFSEAVRGAIRSRSQLDEQAQAGMEALGSRDVNAKAWALDNSVSQIKQRGDAKAAAEAKTAAADAQAKSQRESKDAFYGKVYDKWMHGYEQGDQWSDTRRDAQMLSAGYDDGWTLPERTDLQRSMTPADRRMNKIERDAWTDGGEYGPGTPGTTGMTKYGKKAY